MSEPTPVADTDELLRGIAARIEALASATRALVGAIHSADETNTSLQHAVTESNNAQNALLARARIERAMMIGFSILFGVILLLGGGLGSLVAYEVTHATNDAKRNTDALLVVARQNQTNGDAIKDCTTPGGVCYERGQASQTKAVAQIVAAEALASWCGAHSATPAKAVACVANASKG